MPPTHSEPVQNVGAGVAYRIGATACLASMFAVVKWASGRGVPIFETLFFRSAFAFVPLAIYIARTSGFSILRTKRIAARVRCPPIGLTGMVGSFTAVSYLPLTEATALAFSAPLFMTALSAIILREHVGRHRWGAVAVGFIGVMIMVRPDPAHMVRSVGTLFALLGAVGAAGAMIAIRQIGKTEPGPRIVFYFTLAGVIAGLASAPFGWVMPDALTLALLVAAGLLGGVGQMFLTESLRVAPVAVVAPFDYAQLLWASIIAFFVWGETPHHATLMGAVVVAASGLYIVYREAVRARSR